VASTAQTIRNKEAYQIVSVSQTLRYHRRQLKYIGPEKREMFRDIYAPDSPRDKVYRAIENQIERMEKLLDELLIEAGNDEAKRGRLLAVIQCDYLRDTYMRS
jgi:hypothetical protein